MIGRLTPSRAAPTATSPPVASTLFSNWPPPSKIPSISLGSTLTSPAIGEPSTLLSAPANAPQIKSSHQLAPNSTKWPLVALRTAASQERIAARFQSFDHHADQ